MAWRSKFALVGVLLIPIGIGIHYEVQQLGSWQPPVPPDSFLSHVPKPEAPQHTPDCTVKVDQSGIRTLTVNESFTVPVHVTNEAPSPCKTEIKVFAPGFEAQPPSWEFSVPVKNEQYFKFTLLAKNPGSQTVELNYNKEQGYEQYELGYSVRANSYLPAWLTPFSGTLTAFFGSVLTLPWWIDRREKKQGERNKGRDQKRFGRLMEDGQRLYREIANLRGEDLEAWDTRLTQWQTSVRSALEDINFHADYPEFERAADEIESGRTGW
jgi:hypothetical protein